MIETTTGRELAVVEGEFRDITAPRVNGDTALAAWNAYQELQHKILIDDPKRDDADVVIIDGKKRKKKSAFRKLATYFGLTVEEVSSKIGHRHDERCGKLFAKKNDLPFDVDHEDCGCPIVFAKFVVRAKDPRSGRSFDGLGIASSRERGFGPKQDHNLPALAWTRAANRAIADLIGGGEISAEDPSGPVEERHALGDAGAAKEQLTAAQLQKYEGLWKDAAQDRRDRVRVLLEAEGYGPGEFRKRGAEHFEQVVALLEGRDEVP